MPTTPTPRVLESCRHFPDEPKTWTPHEILVSLNPTRELPDYDLKTSSTHLSDDSLGPDAKCLLGSETRASKIPFPPSPPDPSYVFLTPLSSRTGTVTTAPPWTVRTRDTDQTTSSHSSPPFSLERTESRVYTNNSSTKRLGELCGRPTRTTSGHSHLNVPSVRAVPSCSALSGLLGVSRPAQPRPPSHRTKRPSGSRLHTRVDETQQENKFLFSLNYLTGLLQLRSRQVCTRHSLHT